MPAKKTAASKRGAKSVAKKTPSKKKVISKRTPKKKPAPKKPAATKKVSKKAPKKRASAAKVHIRNNTKASTDPDAKSSLLHTLNQELNKTPKAPKEKPKTKAIKVRDRLSLAALSPYRFPIDAERLAAQTARVAGLAFVFIGALFTITNTTNLTEQMIAIAELQEQQAMTASYTRTEKTLVADDEAAKQAVVAEPTLSFTQLTEDQKVVMKVSAEDANAVSLTAVNASTGDKIELGKASKTSGNTWKFIWETTNTETGEYVLQASVKTDSGTLQTDRKNVKIENQVTREESERKSEKETNHDEMTATSSQEVLDVTEKELPEVPAIDIWLSDEIDVREKTLVTVETSNASMIELYITREREATPRFLGVAGEAKEGQWQYRFDTRQTPDGKYKLYALAMIDGKEYRSDSKTLSIKNQETEPAVVIDRVASTTLSEPDKVVQAAVEETKVVYVQPKSIPVRHEAIKKASSTYAVDEEAITMTPDEALRPYEQRLSANLERYTSAVRSGDEAQIERVAAQLNDLRKEVVLELGDKVADSDIASLDGQLQAHLENKVLRIKESETLVLERVGEAITRDTDQDGITDYDERVLYGTNPELADSDNDGFADGAEILSGFNPNDATPEAIVSFESPKQSPLVRPDILKVADIRKTADPDEREDGVEEEAVITGSALPNSFVTLYIFSTPIVITVKTDENGSWEYVFDKELENGEHEIYIGMTDNSGKIVARSEPFKFVKTAAAYNPVPEADEQPAVVMAGVVEPEPLTNEVKLLFMSVSIILVGVVLILLGLHLHSNRREHLVADEFKSKAA